MGLWLITQPYLCLFVNYPISLRQYFVTIDGSTNDYGGLVIITFGCQNTIE